ncbi:hypothetical protein [Nocardioides marmorisolisilvae]|uniref:hypothetical protein n=1 Tax=Nocardioides marmorisolisilvae TaxID=1542737 RepID=UPI0011CD485F|nr:hypothetical protein [Nocardioides marmorisolisilvae]
MTTTTTAAELTLTPLQLPPAPPVVRARAPRSPRRRWPAVVLLVLGAALVVVPVVGGLFTKSASGQQLIDAFAPHLTPDSLGRYDTDLHTLRTGTSALDRVYARDHVAPGRYPGIDAYRSQSEAVQARATTLLDRIRAAEPDYRKVAGIGGFDRLPFLLVTAGLGLAYAGGVLLSGRQRAGGAAALALLASVALAGYPLISSLPEGSRAGHRLQHALAPVMTDATVLREQRDFVLLVHAVGELDTAFRVDSRRGEGGRQLRALVAAWPTISSDLASLVGAIEDNLDNDAALADLDDLGRPLGVSGLIAMPWLLVGAGGVGAVAALSALPRRRKEAR